MLKKLEIHGFKSFADKTTLTFPRGITAVVGPNGSGKSNVVDAIRWVLGEQSAKHIRVAGATDVIFNGVGQKSAGGFASVTLDFDNGAKAFPVDFEDVVIGRRVYRDGTSDYAINKKTARLKDVTHLLAAAKLGVKGMGIVNQGAADMFLRASAVGRREMLEEMIGLKEFRLKKEEAERRIRESRDNLSKVEGILQEIEPNLRTLRRQVAKWESRAQKETELRALEREYFAYKISEIEREFSSISDEKARRHDFEQAVAMLKQDIAGRQEKLAKLEQEDPGVRKAQGALQAELQAFQQKKSELAHDLGAVEGQLEVYGALAHGNGSREATELLAKLRAVHERLDVLASFPDATELRSALRLLTQDVGEFLARDAHGRKPDEREQPLSERKRQLLAQIAHCTEEMKRLAKDLEVLDRQTGAQSQELRTLVQELETLRARLQDEERQWEQVQFSQERRKLKEDDCAMKMREAGYDWDKFRKQERGLIASMQAAGLIVADAETKLIRLRRDLAVIGEIDPEVVRAHTEASERHEFLSREKQDIESALEDLDGLNASLELKIQEGFGTALAAIDREFNRYFQIIFDGGKASVSVVRVSQQDEGELESVEDKGEQAQRPAGKDNGELGVDFSVHLPRKKVKSLEMLSGGERSLTAIALLFAIITAVTPPLLVLDEIDAALDETNSRKFAKLLKEMTGDVQFIIITHNRSIMEAADVLYGVTMQDGVSKVFSLRFAEAEELAEQDKTS